MQPSVRKKSLETNTHPRGQAGRQQGGGGGRGEDEEERRGEGGRAHSIEPRGHAQLNCTLRAKEI